MISIKLFQEKNHAASAVTLIDMDNTDNGSRNNQAAPLFETNSKNSRKRYDESCGPGLASGWY